jgi:hypothetical protein|tara:strand:- start:2259 stop:2681 length:423 start_codon:yes stop_codon:yes gene_type:complete
MSDTGRPTDYTEDTANKICDLFAMGKSMRQVCLEDGMPVPSTIYLWLSKHREFSDKYVCAKADGQECLVDELSEIADKVLTGDYDPNQARVAADIKKWHITKLAPKKYGDKQFIETKDTTQEITDEDLNAKILELMGSFK